MTTTCTHACPVVNHTSPTVRLPSLSVWQSLAKLGAWASNVYAFFAHRRKTESLDHMDAHQLQDVGAPDWLLQRAAARQALAEYEYIKATSRLKY